MTRAELLSLPKHRFANWHIFKVLAGIEQGTITMQEACATYDLTPEFLEKCRRRCLDALKQTAMYGKRKVA